MISMFPPSQQAAHGNAATFHGDFFRWLSRFVTFTNQTTVPPAGIVFCDLSAGDISDYFDITGLGLARKAYDGWAICNGSNGTTSLPNYSGMTALMRLGDP